MIARNFILLLLLIVLSDFYIDRRMLRRRTRYLWWQRLLWWLPGIMMFVYTVFLAMSRDFAPDSIDILNVYLLLFGIIVMPKSVFMLCSLLGWGHCRFHHTKTNWGNHVGLALALVIVFVVVYGNTSGFSKIVVRHEEYCSADLPDAFDGYRILHFSDAHVGTLRGRAEILHRAVDSINAQNADAIMFTGDLQNMRPSELSPFMGVLSSLKAKDGVFSVLGNHDYSDYIKASDAVKRADERELVNRERRLGWNLLLNGHEVIRRGKDSVVVAGMENDGRPPFPQKGDLKKTLAGVKDGAFVIMLEHDPTAWRRKILPGSKSQLTLSGHTHAMQLSVFGWSPASLIYDEWGGMYHEGSRALNVSVGMGGFIPFRIGASNEIVVITLHKKVKK